MFNYDEFFSDKTNDETIVKSNEENQRTSTSEDDKLFKNRISAKKCREKKKSYYQELEERAKNLELLLMKLKGDSSENLAEKVILS